MYSAAFRHVPVNWIVGIITLFSGVWNCCSWTTERIWSFMNALWYNITGFDKYFIFMDQSPVPIPYWYYGGCPGEAAWLYDARNRIFFNCVDEGHNKKAYLPVLSMDLNASFRNIDDQYDLSDWLSSVTFYTHDSSFPSPLQILSAWSLHSHMWPATKAESNTSFSVIDGDTGDDQIIPLVHSVAKYYWHDYQHMIEEDEVQEDEQPEDDTEESTEDTEEEQSVEDTEEEQPAEDTEEEQPVDEQPVEDTEEEQPVDEQPVEDTEEEQPVEEQPVEDAIEEQSITESQSSEGQESDGIVVDAERDMEAVD
jgi:hypothetical protein